MVDGSPDGGGPNPLAAVRDPDRLRTVRETGLHDPESPDSLGYLTSLATRSLDCSTSFVSILDEDLEVLRACRGEPEPLLAEGTLPVAESFCRFVVAGDGPFSVRDSREVTELAETAPVQQNDLIAYCGAPLRLDGRHVIGSFCVGEPRPRDWTDDEVELLEIFAASAASEIRLRRRVRRLERRESELEERALHDALTGLANRHLLWDRVNHALARSDRTGRHVAILFLDVDDFKSVNDRHGHTAGDRTLEEIGRRIQGAVRDHDTAARFGGDEFVVLLEDLEDPSHAGRIAERIGEALASPVETVDGSVSLSLSMGVSVAGGTAAPDEGDARTDGKAGEKAAEPASTFSLASRGRRLVQEADWAMFRAKRTEDTSWVRY